MKKAARAVACAAAAASMGSTATSSATSPATTTHTGTFGLLSRECSSKTATFVKREQDRTLSVAATTATLIRGGAAHHSEDDLKEDAEHAKKKKKKHSAKKKKRNADKETESEEQGSSTTAGKKEGDRHGKHHHKQKHGETHHADNKSASHHHHHKQHKAHQDKVVQEILDSDDYYTILGVSKTCTPAQIQKAYRRRCVLTHPDKMESGDRNAFDKVAEAYDVLNDNTKRTLYNRHGKAGVTGAQGGRGASFSQEIFRSFFGGEPSFFKSSPRGRYQPRNRTVRYQLEVSLEDLYKGVTRTVIVTKPDGSSSQHQGRKRVEVHVQRGMASGQSITLSGEMDSVQDDTPADLVFLLAQRPHPIFTRKGHDLAIELTIGLQEAMCGVTEHSITHLDGRVITLSSARRSKGDKTESEGDPIMIHTGDVHVLKGEGMPKRHAVGGGTHHGHHEDDDHHDESNYGDLYVQYRVEMPSADAVHKLSDKEREELGRLLAKLDGGHTPNKPKATENNGRVHVLQKANASDFGRASGPLRTEDPHHMHHDDEEDDIGPSFPFGARQFHYYSSNGGGPFGFDRDDFDDDGSNVQCQQM